MEQDAEMPDAQQETPALSDIEALALFRRSPHPYHRRQHELRTAQTASESPSNDLLSSTQPSHYSRADANRRDHIKRSQSPSESGTEADDEGYGLVKALPAPPLRPRKGLRDGRGSGLDDETSPLLTPSQVDEDAHKLSGNYFRARKEELRSGEPSPTDDEARIRRQKYLKRRRSELIRRVTETALLCIIGTLVVGGCRCGELLLQWHRVDLLAYMFIMAGLVGLYPLRILYYSWRKLPPSSLRFRQRIHIPATFDPAPILYPSAVPILISISLFPTLPASLLPNIILSLATLPPQLIPFGFPIAGYSVLHWFISILPLIASENTELPFKLFSPIPYELKLPPSGHGPNPELLVCLFPLHQALLPPLHYLTTTSLLSAELHLFSIGLINLLLFAESPQAVILKTLLWLGGISLFAFCGKVLRWGVALARIPRWRFRRAGRIVRAQQSFLQILNDRLRSQSASRAASDSDADEDCQPIRILSKGRPDLKLKGVEFSRRRSIVVDEVGPQSAIEPKKLEYYEQNGDPDSPLAPPKRRNTVASIPLRNYVPTRTIRHRRRTKSIAQSFLALTPVQAAFRKWLYAGYFHSIVAVLIFGPIRHVIGKYGLQDHEPFGWAIGYLLGNLQRIRFEIFNWDLERWVALPPMLDEDDKKWTQQLSTVEHIRRRVLGEANTRLLLCAYCLGIILLGLLAVFRLTSVVEVDTRRKVFHGMMVAMLLPTIYIDPCFVALALALVLAVFLLLDLIRASQLPPLSGPIATFLTPYVDGRDLRGPVVVSHIFLLIGCAIPLWLSLAGVERIGDEPWQGWEVHSRDVSMVAGVVCVGMGDAAASLIGRRYGRRKWPWVGGKSLEGSFAFAAAVTLGLVFAKAWLVLGWDIETQLSLAEWCMECIVIVGKAALCAVGASLEEAVLTGGNDNVIVPVILWVLVRGVRL